MFPHFPITIFSVLVNKLYKYMIQVHALFVINQDFGILNLQDLCLSRNISEGVQSACNVLLWQGLKILARPLALASCRAIHLGLSHPHTLLNKVENFGNFSNFISEGVRV